MDIDNKLLSILNKIDYRSSILQQLTNFKSYSALLNFIDSNQFRSIVSKDIFSVLSDLSNIDKTEIRSYIYNNKNLYCYLINNYKAELNQICKEWFNELVNNKFFTQEQIKLFSSSKVVPYIEDLYELSNYEDYKDDSAYLRCLPDIGRREGPIIDIDGHVEIGGFGDTHVMLINKYIDKQAENDDEYDITPFWNILNRPKLIDIITKLHPNYLSFASYCDNAVLIDVVYNVDFDTVKNDLLLAGIKKKIYRYNGEHCVTRIAGK